MKNKILTILTLITLITPLFFASTSNVKAAQPNILDYGDISSLEADYSYGTLFWNESTEIKDIVLNGGSTQTFTEDEEDPNKSSYTFKAFDKDSFSFRITKCAVDKDGNLCDVICKIDNVNVFGGEYSREDGNFVYLKVGKYTEYAKRSSGAISNLVRFWFNSNSACGHFSMQYVRTGTNTPANVKKAAASIGDIDVDHMNTETKLYGDENHWYGAEGFTLDGIQGKVYYKKNNYLIDVNDEKGIGVKLPSRMNGNINKTKTDGTENTTIPEGVQGITYDNDIDLYNSAVATEEMGADSTFKLYYSGYGCGIIYVFASPYSFGLNKPLKEASKDTVYEGEKFNYEITQYIPNNYYASQMNFIEGANGTYKAITITDTLNEKLNVDGGLSEITIVDENNSEVNYFDVSLTGKKITAVAKEDALDNIDFYGHSYKITIPVSVTNVSGTEITKISNTGTTVVKKQDDTEENKDTDPSEVSIKYKVDFITNGGTLKPDDQDVLAGGKATDPNYQGTKPGYTFEGWSSTDPDKEAKQEYDFNQAIYEDKTLYGIWNPIEYKINYVLNGGANDPTNPTKYTVEDTINFKEPTKEGYEFKGWYEDEALNTPKPGITHETGDKTVYAKWEAKNDVPYKVEHYKEGKDGKYALEVTDDKTGTTDEKVTAVPKNYDGFKENKTYSERISEGIIKADGSLVLKLYYDREKYTVTFDTKGGSPKPDNQIVRFEDKAEEPQDPTKDGYKFKYWYYLNDKDEKVEYNFDDPVVSDIDLIAEWEEIPAPVEEPEKKDEEPKKSEPEVIQKDTTVATRPIPQTGGALKIIAGIAFIVIAGIIGIIYGIKYFRVR